MPSWVYQNFAEAQRADVLKLFSVLAVAASREAIQSSFEEANSLADRWRRNPDFA